MIIMMELKEKLFSDEIKRLTPVLSRETAERLSRAYLIGDETTRKRLIEMLDIMKASILMDTQLRDAPLLEPPAIEGDIEIGELTYGHKPAGKLMWDKSTFMTHVGIFGSSGYGKTNLSYLLIKRLSDQGVPVIIFDFSKKNYRDLCQTDVKDRINIYTVGSNVAPLKFNPLKSPPGISKTQWVKEFAEIFDHAYWLLGGGRHIIMKALNDLYDQNDKPILADLKKMIEEYSSGTSREKNWVSTSMRPLDSLCMKETGDIFNLADGVRPSSFFEPGKITILEMDSLSTNDRMFFIEIMMQWIRDWLLTYGEREQLNGVVILEEAHHILNREKSKKLGSETVMDLVFREMRELGLGIVYLDQHPSMVSYPALGNTSTHIYMNLGLDTRYSSDVQDAINMLGLDDDYGEYLRRFQMGNAFVLMRHSTWTKPFTARFPLVSIKKGLIKDADIVQMMKHKIDFGEEKMEKLDDTQMNIIGALGKGKGVFTSQLYTSLKMSGAVFKEKISTMLRSGYVDVREVRIEKTKANYYYLTEKGEKTFSENFENKIRSVGSAENTLKIFDALGWKYDKIGNDFHVSCDNKNIIVRILTENNRVNIESMTDNNVCYICSTPEIKNILLQYAAKLSEKRGNMKIRVALMENFDKTGFTEFIL